MPARRLVVGIDGADWDLIHAIGSEQLPHLFALMQGGDFGRLQSVKPAATLPNWLTFLTGENPGRHGVFDFARRRGYQVALDGARCRKVPTWIEILDSLGFRCAHIGFPGTWPPAQLRHGIWMSGWDSPVAFEADASFVWPRTLHSKIVARFGPERFDDADQWNADDADWLEHLPKHLIAKIKRKRDLGIWLMEGQTWDTFAIYFGESDTASHYLWHVHDPKSPRRPRQVSSNLQSGLTSVYRALDDALGALMDAARDNRLADAPLTCVVVSDHGSGGSSDRILHLNTLLSEIGLLSFKKSKFQRYFRNTTRDLRRSTMALLSPRTRQWVFKKAHRWVGHAESALRYGAIDMQRTMAFSDELNYFPAIHWNLRGREPCGQVRPSERERMFQRLSDALLSLRDPETHDPVIKHIWPRETIYEGLWVHDAPDMVLELNLRQGYSYNLMPSRHDSELWRILPPEQYGGKKGRCLPGSHRSKGVHLMRDSAFEGRGFCEHDMVTFSRKVFRMSHARASVNVLSVHDTFDNGREDLVERRLAQLGYFD